MILNIFLAIPLIAVIVFIAGAIPWFTYMEYGIQGIVSLLLYFLFIAWLMFGISHFIDKL